MPRLLALFLLALPPAVCALSSLHRESLSGYDLSRAVYLANGTVTIRQEGYESASESLRLLKSEGVFATATYAHARDGDWNKLWVKGVDLSREAFYAAGFLEGKLTAVDIESMYINMYADWFTNSPFGPKPAPVFSFLNQNHEWMKEEVARQANRSAYWKNVGLVMAQLEGLAAGYASESLKGTVKKLSVIDMLFLNADGDVESLTEFLPQRDSTHVRHGAQRCSAIFKILPKNADILFAHTTWDHYSMMLRTLKTYRFGDFFVTFSSSPAFLSSVDDFYITGKGLAVIETTNGNHNKLLWQKVTPKSVLSWIRVTVANLKASTAPQWVSTFSHANSGTYNNQWMVLDTKLFVEGQRLPKDTFWVLEQLPELVVAADKSEELQENMYWASYNIPYYKKVYNISGFSRLLPRWKFSHKLGPRAQIFRVKQEEILGVDDLKRAIRYNDFQNDTLSRGDACNQISARCDLNTGLARTLSGGIDGKVSSIKLMRREASPLFWAQQGPSYDDQAPFTWQDFKPSVRYPKVPKHHGQTEGKFMYKWKLFTVYGEYNETR